MIRDLGKDNEKVLEAIKLEEEGGNKVKSVDFFSAFLQRDPAKYGFPKAGVGLVCPCA